MNRTYWRSRLVVGIQIGMITASTGCVTAAIKTVDDARRIAEEHKAVIDLPEFETSAYHIGETVGRIIAEGRRALDEIGGQDLDQVSFQSTVRAMSDALSPASLAISRIYLMKETSTNAAIREAATEGVKKMEDWFVGLDYREDLFNVVKALEKKNPELTGEDKKIYEETLRDFKRAGLYLPKAEREEVEALRKKLSKLTTDFDSNITKAKKELKYSKADLEGLPESFLENPELKTGDDEYTVMANITWHAITLLRNAKKEATRKKFYMARHTLAKEGNSELLNQIIATRDLVADKLGYKSWADYKVETRMAKNAKTALKFVADLRNGLRSKLDSEVAELRKLKVKDTGDESAQIHIWDWRYYANELKKQKYDVDTEALRVYFPYQKVLNGMFDIYQSIFGLTFTKVEPPYKWADDVELHVVTDTATGEPLGCFYLDMFPRDGKYNHFAQFGIISGGELPDGRYQRPTVALICNFPPPGKDKPSLLAHSDVETLFHEFGHAMHSILTRARYTRFSGTSVPRDFVEAPSQMLEYWAWDKSVLDEFAADYRDETKKIPVEMIVKMDEARKAINGLYYSRQLAFGTLDLTLHAEREGTDIDAVGESNKILSDVFLKVGEGTSFVTYFGHLSGYDAGYYGYVWAESIAADMATRFENAKGGFMDKEVGMSLRREIYAPGDSRDVNISIQKFLGRERSLQPYLKKLGLE